MPEMPKIKSPLLKEANGCWWLTKHSKNAYAGIVYEGKIDKAHRAFYRHYKGPIPDGYVIDHLCRNIWCVNPDHLEAVTQRENLMRQPNFGRNKTHCLRGHEFTSENTYWQGTRRSCKTCRAANFQAYKASRAHTR